MQIEDRKNGEVKGTWARGTTMLPEGWKTLNVPLQKAVKLDPVDRSQQYTVELQITVLQLDGVL